MADDNGDEPTSAAVLGLGNMGRALAGALIDAGLGVMVWNRSPEATTPLVARGAQRAESVVDAVRFGPLVFICVLDQVATKEMLAVDGARQAIAGRTVVQFSNGAPDEAASLERWCRDSGARFLQGSIKAYPSDIGSAAALLTYAGVRDTFDTISDTLEVFGKAVHVGESVAAASALADAGSLLFEISTAAFFELAAYVTANGGEAKDLAAIVASALRFTVHTVERSVDQLEAGTYATDEASIDVNAAGIRTTVKVMERGGCDPRLTRATLSYLEDAQAAGLGHLDIAALFTTVGVSLR